MIFTRQASPQTRNEASKEDGGGQSERADGPTSFDLAFFSSFSAEAIDRWFQDLASYEVTLVRLLHFPELT